MTKNYWRCIGCDIVCSHLEVPPPADMFCARCFIGYSRDREARGLNVESAEYGKPYFTDMSLWIHAKKHNGTEICFVCNKNQASLHNTPDGFCRMCYLSFEGYLFDKGIHCPETIPENFEPYIDWIADWYSE
jgi:cytidine deaminase